MGIFDSLNLVSLPDSVQTALGGFITTIVSIGLNLLAIGVIFFLVYRLATISVQAIFEFRKGDDEGSKILFGAIKSIGATVGAGFIAWLFITLGMPLMLQYATDATSSVSDKVSIVTNPLDTFLENNGFLKVIYDSVQGIGSIAVIAVAGLLLAQTGVNAIGKTKFSPDSSSGNQFEPVKKALQRGGVIIVLAVIGWVVIKMGPMILFSYLSELQNKASSGINPQ